MRIDPKLVDIRPANIADVPAIAAIYNEAVLNGIATFDTEPKSIESFVDRIKQNSLKHPLWVAVVDNTLVAYASLNKWSDKSAYDTTAEVSVYVHLDYRAKGIGTLIFECLLKEAENVGLHYLLSRITQGNDTSIRLHKRNGFSLIGVMHEVGYKFGSFLDVTLLEKILK